MATHFDEFINDFAITINIIAGDGLRQTGGSGCCENRPVVASTSFNHPKHSISPNCGKLIGIATQHSVNVCKSIACIHNLDEYSLECGTHAIHFGHTPVTPQLQLRSRTMASIPRSNNLWRVQVRIRHAGSTSKSFHRKTDAERWAIAQEALIQSGQWQEKTPNQYTIGNMLSRYLDIVTPTKRGREQEKRRLQRLLRDKQLMFIRPDQAQPFIFADFRDRCIHDGVRACQHDLVFICHAWNIARIEWGWPLPNNPISLIRMPKNNPPRERRLKDGEFKRLRIAAEKSQSWYLWPVVVLA